MKQSYFYNFSGFIFNPRFNVCDFDLAIVFLGRLQSCQSMVLCFVIEALLFCSYCYCLFVFYFIWFEMASLPISWYESSSNVYATTSVSFVPYETIRDSLGWRATCGSSLIYQPNKNNNNKKKPIMLNVIAIYAFHCHLNNVLGLSNKSRINLIYTLYLYMNNKTAI